MNRIIDLYGRPADQRRVGSFDVRRWFVRASGKRAGHGKGSVRADRARVKNVRARVGKDERRGKKERERDPRKLSPR